MRSCIFSPNRPARGKKGARETAAALLEGRSRKSKRSVLKRLATGGDEEKRKNVTLNGDPRCNVTPGRAYPTFVQIHEPSQIVAAPVKRCG